MRQSKMSLNDDPGEDDDELPVVEDMASPMKANVHFESMKYNRYEAGATGTGIDSNFGMTIVKDGSNIFGNTLMASKRPLKSPMRNNLDGTVITDVDDEQ